MKLLGESVRVRYLQELGREAALPEDGYQGEYIRDVARKLVTQVKDDLIESTELSPFVFVAVEEIFRDIRSTCNKLEIHFDVFSAERDLMTPQPPETISRVDAVLGQLRERGLLADYDGAIWLRGEPLGLPKDAVLVRSGPDREPTYRTPDIAYHIDKLKRGFDLVIDVFGADHIAEHQQVIAAVKALGYDVTPIRAIIYQFVTLTRAGEKVKMSTRKATYVTLDELIDEVGRDVVRFFFLFRKHDSHLDFDLDLAKRQAPENPVFYVQYAHARLASVFREALRAGFTLPDASGKMDIKLSQEQDEEADKAGLMLPDPSQPTDLALLSPEEVELAKRAVGFAQVVADAVAVLEPHRIPFYLLELAGEFHRYYNKPANRILNRDDPKLSEARLFLAAVLRDAIAGGLDLLGVSAPDRM
jgi:arginyl-tRNA synthetase